MANVAKESRGAGHYDETVSVDEVFADLWADDSEPGLPLNAAPLVKKTSVRQPASSQQVIIPAAVHMVGVMADRSDGLETTPQTVVPLAPDLSVEHSPNPTPGEEPTNSEVESDVVDLQELEYLRERLPQLEDRIAELLEKNSEIERLVHERNSTVEKLRQERKLDYAQAKRERETWELRLEELQRQLETEEVMESASIDPNSCAKSVEVRSELDLPAEARDAPHEELFKEVTERMIRRSNQSRHRRYLARFLLGAGVMIGSAGAALAAWFVTQQ